MYLNNLPPPLLEKVDSKLVKNLISNINQITAHAGNRTRIATLEGLHTDHCTTCA